MAYENLLKSIEESAKEKERELKEKAQKQADEIRDQARKRAQEIQDFAVKDAERKGTIERNKQIFLAKGKIKSDALVTKEKIFETAFRQATDRLTLFRQDPKYPEVFKRLMIETIAEMGGARYILHIDPQDLDLCKKISEEIDMQGGIRTDITCIGGISASSIDGDVVVSNTFESRLARVKEQKRNEIHAKLQR